MGALDKAKSTAQSQTSQQNQFGFMQAPDNPYYKNAEQLIDGYDGGASGVREGAARNVNDIKNSGNEFFGAQTPDYARDATRESRLFRNNSDLGRGLSDATQNANAYKTSAYMGLGAATAPQLVQTGSTGTANQSGTGTPGALSTLGKGMGIIGA